MDVVMKKSILLVLLLAIVGAIALAFGLGSRSVEQVRSEIRALPKNEPFYAALKTIAVPGFDAPALYAHFRKDPGPADDDGAPPKQPPIVLIHGTPDSMGAWNALLFGEGRLAGAAEIYAIEVVGHGMAGAAEGTHTFEFCAEYVAEVLRALGLSGVTLVGNSYGGEFCWRTAVDHPELVGKLVLIDSSGLPRSEEEFLSEEVKMRDWPVARYGYLLNSESRVASALDPQFDGNADEARVREVYLGLENRGNWNAMIDLVRDEDGARAGDLAKVEAPTLLLWGEDDEAYEPEKFGREFERRIPESRLVVFDGVAHYPHEEVPAAVAREISAFHAR